MAETSRDQHGELESGSQASIIPKKRKEPCDGSPEVTRPGRIAPTTCSQTSEQDASLEASRGYSTTSNPVKLWDFLVQKQKIETNRIQKETHDGNSPDARTRAALEERIQGLYSAIQYCEAQLRLATISLRFEQFNLNTFRQDLENLDKKSQENSLECFDKAGLSQALYTEYLAFESSFTPSSTPACVSLEAVHGLSCDGIFGQHDSIFTALKLCLKDRYRDIDQAPNMKIEVTNSVIRNIKAVELEVDKFLTWGENYPKLYQLVIAAVRNGSEVALDMLVGLPDRDAICTSGWLLSFIQDESRGPSSRFCSAHKIAAPHNPNVKREELQRVLQPDAYAKMAELRIQQQA